MTRRTSPAYVRCPLCACQYDPRVFRTACPRISWHPAHGTSDADRGLRARVLDEARAQAEQDRHQRDRPFVRAIREDEDESTRRNAAADRAARRTRQ